MLVFSAKGPLPARLVSAMARVAGTASSCGWSALVKVACRRLTGQSKDGGECCTSRRGYGGGWGRQLL